MNRLLIQKVYDGADRSRDVADSPVYNDAKTGRAFGKLTEHFGETLPRWRDIPDAALAAAV